MLGDMAEEKPTPEQEVRRLYEETEGRVAKAAERVVSRDSFGELLALMTENVVALTSIGNEAMDLVLRNLRITSRRDIVLLARQLARTEDKLELVLQEVERLDPRAAQNGAAADKDGAPAPQRTRRGSGGNTSRRRQSRT
jgi:hypothetical protein